MLGARDEAGKAGDGGNVQVTVSCAKEVGLMRGQWESVWCWGWERHRCVLGKALSLPAPWNTDQGGEGLRQGPCLECSYSHPLAAQGCLPEDPGEWSTEGEGKQGHGVCF